MQPLLCACTCKLEGSQMFRLDLSATDISACSAKVSSVPSILVNLESVPKEYHDFADVFSKAKAKTLGPHRPYDLKITLEDGTKMPHPPLYSLSNSELEALRMFIDEHLNIAFIRSSRSPHAALILFVRKKDGSLRLCVDFQALNKVTKKDCYPLPLISDLLDRPRKAHIYSKINLRHAYHLIQIAKGNEWKTAFKTRYGSYEWLVMPFGLSNAPAAFQQFINDILGDLLDHCTVAYIDDILIYSDSLEQHREHVREILRRLRKNGLYAKASKCEWHKDTVKFLGYILRTEGLTMAEDKVKTIHDWREPRKVKDIQSFLGFANFYPWFMFNFSDITVPLTRLTRKGTPWAWTEDCQKSFNFLKTAFTSTPILHHWDPNRILVVETDTSDYALAAILSVIDSEGEIRPVAFHSRTFTAPELNYDVHDKELLAIFEAFKCWRHYLEGSAEPIDVVTDHKNLEYFCTTKVVTRWRARSSKSPSQFNLTSRFCPGKLSTKLDSLTRRWDVYLKEG